MKLYFVICLSFLIASCNAAEFTEFTELGDLRILGIVADSSEIDGTSTGAVNITLTPFISDISAAGRTFQVSVVSCLDTGFVTGNQPGCENPQVEVYPNANTFDTTSLAASDHTGNMDPITITVNNPASLISGFSDQRKFNGVSYFIVFSLVNGSERLTAVKELVITTRTPLNQNPSISSVNFDGVALTSGPSSEGELTVSFGAGGEPESFQEQKNDGTLEATTESYLISFFTDREKVSPARILDGQSATYLAKESGSTRLVVVVKDRRGGTAIQMINP